MARLGDERAVPSELDPGPPTVFRADGTWPALLAQRLDALEERPGDVRAVDPDAEPAALHVAGCAIARHAEREHPGRVRVEGDDVWLPRLGVRIDAAGVVRTASGVALPALGADARRRAIALLRDRPAHLRCLETLALALQEDLVLIGARDAPAFRVRAESVRTEAAYDDAAGSGRAAWLHVAFPSGWDPGAMAGASFERLHAPVPDADGLQRAAPALIDAMLSKGPFVRYVWGVSPDGARSRHPRHARAMRDDHPIERAWLRVERQTTLPLAGLGLALFAIGVHVTPLTEALRSPDRRAAFVDAIASLSPAARRYKGVPWSDERVRAWRDRRA
jgi:hypothetical protein